MSVCEREREEYKMSEVQTRCICTRTRCVKLTEIRRNTVTDWRALTNSFERRHIRAYAKFASSCVADCRLLKSDTLRSCSYVNQSLSSTNQAAILLNGTTVNFTYNIIKPTDGYNDLHEVFPTSDR